MKVTFLKQKTFILPTPQMKDDMARNIFHIKNYLLEMTPSQGKCITKAEIVNGKSHMKKLYTKLPVHVSAELCIITQSHFREKPFYVKRTTFSTAKETKSETKPVNDSESKSKIKVRLPWTVFLVLVPSRERRPC